IRLFDVEGPLSTRRAPGLVAPITFAGEVPPGIEVVPVIYLRESALRRGGPEGARDLAAQVWREVDARAREAHLAVRELKMDCDWSEGTRAAYFTFLATLRDLARPTGITLSATIRLHQIKYRERTGVPPVDRGMLMFYNIGRIG